MDNDSADIILVGKSFQICAADNQESSVGGSRQPNGRHYQMASAGKAVIDDASCLTNKYSKLLQTNKQLATA